MDTPENEVAMAPVRGPSAVRIRINRRGQEPVWALVDAEDVERVNVYKWHLNTDGYATRSVKPHKGVKEPMARLIMGLSVGDGLEVDHESRDRLDNRKSNLRICTHAQNAQNRRRRGGKSRFRGVSHRKDRSTRPWQAYACVMAKQVHLGFFENELEAARAAESYRRQHMDFAVWDVELNPIPPCQCKECRS